MASTPLSVSTSVTSNFQTVIAIDTPLISATLNIRFLLNNMDISSKLQAAIVPLSFDNNSDTVASSQWLQPVDIILGPAGVTVGIVEDTGVVILAGYKLIAKVDTGVITCRAHGFGRMPGA
jgi:hypothetical protein